MTLSIVTISAYNHILRAPENEAHHAIVANRLTLIEALAHPTLAVHLNNVATRMLGSELDLSSVVPDRLTMRLASRLAWETPADEFTYRRALRNLASLDFVGFTERSERDCRWLAERLNFNFDFLERENTTPDVYDWPLPKAVRDREVEQAVKRYSFFDCAMYDEARTALWDVKDGDGYRAGQSHLAMMAEDEKKRLFTRGVPRLPEFASQVPNAKSHPTELEVFLKSDYRRSLTREHGRYIRTSRRNKMPLKNSALR